MRKLGCALAMDGWTLRSGAAPGSDTAFERGCDAGGGAKEIYLPWKGFSKHDSTLFYVSPEALEIAEEIYGPAFKYLKRPVKLLMARNMYQVTGVNLDTPSQFIVCWTSDGCNSAATRNRKTGGTGQAIAYASSLQIPVFNLQRKGEEEKLLDFIADHD